MLEQFKDFAGDLKDRTSADVFEIAMMIAKHKYPTLVMLGMPSFTRSNMTPQLHRK